MRCKINFKAIAVVAVVFAGIAFAEWSPLDKLNHEISSATSTITYNGRHFTIKGNPVFLRGGEMHPSRIPQELWRDRMTRLRRAGYNCVQNYMFWNMIEPVQGQFHLDSTGLDMDAWCSALESVGMYGIVRAGPYCCAEWDYGGFPPWLADVSNLNYRVSNGPFMGLVDAYWRKAFPPFLKHQITKGGCIIGAQLENEYWNTDNTYYNHLVDTARALGLEVPFVWSQVNHGNDPWPPAFSTGGSAPWYSTEYWTGWISVYGEYSSTTIEQGTNRIIASGTGGYSHYMAHGGTNFGYTASPDQRITSYDYGAPIGELGQFRSYYWPVKRANLLAQSFEQILANSTNGASQITLTAASGSISGFNSYVNTSPNGTIAFVYNNSTASASFKLKWNSKNVTVPATFNQSLGVQKFVHFFSDVPVTDNVLIDYSACGVEILKKFGTRTYLVLYGDSSATGEIALKFTTVPSPTPALPWTWDATASRASLVFTYPAADSVYENEITAGNGQTLTLLIMKTSMANRTWTDTNFIISGAEYVDENKRMQFKAQGGRATIYTAAGRTPVIQPATTAPSAKSFSSGWTWLACPEVSPTFDASSWQSHSGYQDMGSFGWANGYGWYRCTYNASQAGSVAITPVGNAVTNLMYLFVNGTATSSPAQLQSGANTIIALVCSWGRDKEVNYYGAPSNIDRTGLISGLSVNGQNFPGTGTLLFKGGFDGLDESPLLARISPTAWNNYLNRQWNTTTAPGDNIPKFWRMDFNYTPPANTWETWTLNGTVSNTGSEGVVFVNGHCLGRQLTSQPALFVPQCWLKGTNTIIVFTNNGSAPQNYSMQLGEYRSIMDFPTGIIQPASRAELISTRFGTDRSFVMKGNRFVLPRDFAEKEKRIAVYDLSGKLLETSLTKDNVVALKRGGGVADGVYIVRARAIGQ
jgi:beta-galactosidase